MKRVLSSARRSILLRTNRMEAFSDGVFAIAITLLVLELSIPETSVSDPIHAIMAEWPKYLAYLVSFASIGAIWLEHNTITEHMRHTDIVFIRLNLMLLFLVSFLPFPTGLLSEFHGHLDAEFVAVTFYGVTLLAAAGMVALLWRYAIRAKLIREDLADDDARVLARRLNPSLLGYLALILAGMVFPRVALVGYLVLALAIILPVGLFRRPRG